jgi:LysM repeat protein
VVPAGAQGQNYLQNPGFEGAYYTFVPGTPATLADCPAGICTTVQVAQGWQPWWVKERHTDVNPEFKAAALPYENRIHSGLQAGQYFSFYRTHKAGFFQQATVPANAPLEFSIWGQAWVSNDGSLGSDRGAPVNMRVGIDPTGGTNPFSATVIWSALMQPYDSYQLLQVRAQAQGNVVTVFTYSAPEYPMQHNNVYWDDASLMVVDAAPVPPAPAPPPAATPPPAPAPPPPEGSPPASGQYTVQSGDTLAAIARRYGVSLTDLIVANNIENPNLIRVGQVLTIPGAAAPAPAPAPGPAPAPSPVGLNAIPFVNLRLRAGPATSYQHLTTVPNGTTVPAVGRNMIGDWIQVSYEGQTGWMAGWYLRLSGGTVDDLPVRSP